MTNAQQPQLLPIKDAIANVRRLMRQTAITAAVNVLLDKYYCYDDEEADWKLTSVEDFQACDVMRINCIDKTTNAVCGQLIFAANNGSTPAEDFCDWTTSDKNFDRLLCDIVDALDFEC